MPSGCANGSRSSPAASSASKARYRTRASGCGRRCGCGPAPPTARGGGRCRRDAESTDGVWHFELPGGGVEPLLKALIDGGAGIEELSIERAGLHDAFVAIAGPSAAREMEANEAADIGAAA